MNVSWAHFNKFGLGDALFLLSMYIFTFAVSEVTRLTLTMSLLQDTTGLALIVHWSNYRVVIVFASVLRIICKDRLRISRGSVQVWSVTDDNRYIDWMQLFCYIIASCSDYNFIWFFCCA